MCRNVWISGTNVSNYNRRQTPRPRNKPQMNTDKRRSASIGVHPRFQMEWRRGKLLKVESDRNGSSGKALKFNGWDDHLNCYEGKNEVLVLTTEDRPPHALF